jgi:hypothetical protein
MAQVIEQKKIFSRNPYIASSLEMDTRADDMDKRADVQA